MAAKKSKVESFDLTDETHFINVDLDVHSRTSLQPLADAFGDAVSVLYVGGSKRVFEAHFELAESYGKDADTVTQGLVDLILELPPRVRKLWNAAHRREFNIGIQSALKPHSHEIKLSTDTLHAVARIRGSIVITTYAPDPELAASARAAD